MELNATTSATKQDNTVVQRQKMVKELIGVFFVVVENIEIIKIFSDSKFNVALLCCNFCKYKQKFCNLQAILFLP